MIRGFYTARSGLITHQENMNILANNMANVNTAGFKAIRSSFTDLMYQNLNCETAANTAQAGHGVKINKTDLLMDQGAFEPTQRALDFALTKENAFFAVQNADGEIQYTRAGNFILSGDGDTYYLAAANGDRVLDMDGEEIELELDEDENPILEPGVVGVYTFPNHYGLAAAGNSRLAQTELSGEAEAVDLDETELPVMSGYLEKSAVEMASEMVKVIEASKAFSFSARMVQVADEVEQTVNSLR